jgi:uncharacterized protein YbjT (DUF2867 family)
MKVVVTGSLGHIGKPLTQGLVQKGHSVTVISSKPERQEEIESLGAKAAIGSVDDIDFLVSVFTGADVVHTMVPPDMAVADPVARNRKVGENLAKAVELSGVKRVVYVSSYGAQLPKGTGLIVGHHYIENAFSELPDMEAVVSLRATYIYYNLYAYVNMIKTAGFIAANYGGDDKVVLVSPKDIAAAAVEEIESETTGHRVRYVAGDERTCNEIARVLGEAIGKPDLQWITISDKEMQKGMEAHGLPAAVAACFVEMFGACHNGLLNEDYELTKPHKMGEVKLEEFAREFASAFNAK